MGKPRAMARVFAFLALLALVIAARAQEGPYPSRPLVLLVPYAPGGSADVVARLLGAKLQVELGRPVVVENRVGGSELVATEALAHAEPDGYTLAILSNALSINETLVSDKKYNTARDLAPVAKVIELPFAILTSPKLDVSNLADLVALAKAKPGSLAYGHLGPGSPHFMIMEWFKRVAGVDILAVPYGGATPAYAGLLGNEVQLIASGVGSALPYINAGRAKPLVVLTKQRSALLPGTPTIVEAGYPQFNLTSWMGIFTREGTPSERIRKLSDAVVKIAQSDDIARKLLTLGYQQAPLAADAFARWVRDDAQNWAAVTKASLGKP